MEPGFLLADRYRLEAPLGDGATVWRGRDETTGRAVAVTVLPPGSPGANPVHRFRREAAILAGLDGPGFAALRAADETDHGRHVVTDLVEGATPFTSGPADPERTARHTAEAADALDTAHRSGLVHRDLAPARLLIDADDHVRVTGFGIARHAKALPADAAHTAPELRDDAPATDRSDQYALASIARERLTGGPHGHATAPAALPETALPDTALPETALPETALPDTALPETALPETALPDTVPAAFAAALTRALDPDPAARWASCADFAAACRGHRPGAETTRLDTGPSTDSLPTEVLPLAAPEPKRRTTIAILAVTAALIAATAGLVAWRQWPADTPGAAAEATRTATEAPAPTGTATEPAPTDPATETAAPDETASADPTGETTAAETATGAEPSAPAESSAEATAAVPDVRGMLLADATDTLAEAGFHQVEVYSADVLDHPGAVVIACQVAEQTPADGEAPPDQVISLGVYAAPETGHVCG